MYLDHVFFFSSNSLHIFLTSPPTQFHHTFYTQLSLSPKLKIKKEDKNINKTKNTKITPPKNKQINTNPAVHLTNQLVLIMVFTLVYG